MTRENLMVLCQEVFGETPNAVYTAKTGAGSVELGSTTLSKLIAFADALGMAPADIEIEASPYYDTAILDIIW